MTILVTAGPTRERLDPVRYLGNRSSGKMGYAVATAAARAGHRVLLISGPTALELPEGVDFIPVESALEMYKAVRHWISRAEAAIFTAAVADYRPLETSAQKLKKGAQTTTLELVKNPDILAAARPTFRFQGVLVGFAAETQNLLENAQKKCLKKECDVLFANDVSQPNQGFNSDENTLYAVYPHRIDPLGSHSKTHLGKEIVSIVEHLAKKK